MDVGKEMLLSLLNQIRRRYHLYLAVVRDRGNHSDPVAAGLAKWISRDWDTYYMLKDIYTNQQTESDDE